MAQRDFSEYWRYRLQHVYPNGYFAKYTFASPKYLMARFGPHAIEESDFALAFANEMLAEQVLTQDKANYIIANKESYSARLIPALVNQGALNALILTTQELNINGNAAAAIALVPRANAPVTPGQAGGLPRPRTRANQQQLFAETI